MTFFACESCKCCEEGCPRTLIGCFKATFTGFDASVPGCTECEKIDSYSLIMRRDEMEKIGADVTVVRSSTPAEGAVDADIEVTLKRDEDGSYHVETVSIIDGGTDYTGCAEMKLLPQGASIKCKPPVFALELGRDEPQIEAKVGEEDMGGAQFNVILDGPNGTPPHETWSVASVEVVSGGNGYADGAGVVFTLTRGAMDSEASATIRTTRWEPYDLGITCNGTPISQGYAVFEQIPGEDAWQVTGVDYLILTGAQPGDELVFAPSATAIQIAPASAVVASVDEWGYASITMTNGGSYYRDSGIVSAVEVSFGGGYYSAGAILSVEIVKPGRLIPLQPCRYDSVLCHVCTYVAPSHHTSRLVRGELNFDTSVPGRVTFRLHRAAPVLDLRAEITDWDGSMPLEFPPESFSMTTGCSEVGTVTIEEASCDEYTLAGGCSQLPDQITLTLQNYNILHWTTAPPGGDCQGGGQRTMQNWHCGECQTSTTGDCNARLVASAITCASSAFGWLDDGDYVLDRIWPKYERPVEQPEYEHPDFCNAVYEGHVAVGPSTSQGFCNPVPPFAIIDCQEEVTTPVRVVIAPISCQPYIYIAPPTPNTSTHPPCAPVTCEPASATVGGVTNGAVTSITVVSGGACYAWRTYAKREPTEEEITVEITSENGTDAELVVEWEPIGEGENIEGFMVSGFTVNSGGQGYAHGDPITLTINEDNEFTICEGWTGSFQGTVVTDKEPPEAELVPDHGEGAAIEIQWEPVPVGESDPECLEEWRIASINVTSGGSDYKQNGTYGFNLIDGTIKKTTPWLRITVDAPAATATAVLEHPGAATFSVTLQEHIDPWTNDKHWTVQDIAITNGGTGYPDGLYLLFAADAGEMEEAPVATISVDQDGVVTSVNIENAGRFISERGPLVSVEPFPSPEIAGGIFYKDTGVIACVDITNHGHYATYEPDGVESEQPYMAVESRCHTADAELEAVIDLDPESPSFGAITAITVLNGGAGYSPDLYGWELTLIGVGGHRTIGPGGLCFGPQNVINGGCRPDPLLIGQLQAQGCPDVSNWFLLNSTRTTTNECPDELLTRTYKMFYAATLFPGAADCQAGTDCLYGQYNNAWYVIDGGSGEFQCTIAPA